MDGERHEKMLLQAPAKVNLLLKVRRRRADGYHELETWMQKLDLCDDIELRLTRTPDIGLSCQGGGVPADETNLAWRAADSFLRRSRRLEGRGVEISLVKNIPAAAGLGGGSSDAGTVLRGLNHMAGDEFDDAELVDLARPLGADVPFFAVEHQAVLATGIGDVMRPVSPLGDWIFVLVNPGFAVSTRWVFETFALTTGGVDSILAGFREHTPECLSIACMDNDLEPVTSGKFPEIGLMRKVLLDAGAEAVMMSGSGPTVFGLFPDRPHGTIDTEAMASELSGHCPAKVYATRAWVGAWPSGQGTGF